MKSRRFVLVILLILASVFFISCGIPTYLIPDESLRKVSNTDNIVKFTLSYNSENSGKANTDQIGLVLLYEISSSARDNRDLLNSSWYKKNIRLAEYDGIPLDVDYNNLLTSIEQNSETYVFYAFEFENNSIQAPSYSMKIDDSHAPVNITISLSLDKNTNSISVKALDQNNNAYCDDFKLYLNKELNLNSGDYIHIYGAISSRGLNYSNNYWSKDLTSLGSIEIE